MTTLDQPRQTETIGDGLPGPAELVVANGVTIHEGSQVGMTAAGLATNAAAGTAVAYVGKALHTVIGDGVRPIRYMPGVHVWENSTGDAVTAADIGNVVYGEDDETICKTAGALAPSGILVGFDANGPRVFQSVLLAGLMITTGTSAAALTIALAAVTGGAMVGTNAAGYIAATVTACLAEVKAIADAAAIEAPLFSNANGDGLSTIGFEDAGNFTTAADPEAALQEIYQHLKTAKALLPGCSLFALREVSAAGDVGNIAGGCGNLASDTTPILRGDAAESQEVYWAAGNSDIVAAQFALPLDFDDTRDVTVTLTCYQDNTNTDPANFTVESSWDGGALVVDAAAESGVSGVAHDNVATIAAADIPASAKRLTLLLTPPAHAADGIGLVNFKVEYGRKLQTA